jgi:DNA-binding transcriptional regulator PaaX
MSNIAKLSSTKGKNKLRKHSDKLVTRTLHLLDRVYKLSEGQPNDKLLLVQALEKYLEIMPYLRPKLTAIALGDLEDDGSISPARVRQHALAAIKEMQQLADGEIIEGQATELPETQVLQLPDSKPITMMDSQSQPVTDDPDQVVDRNARASDI